MKLIEIVILSVAGVWQGVRQDLNLLELVFIAVAYWAWTKKHWRPDLLWTWAPRRPWLAALSITAGAILLRLALIPLLPVPIPVVTDEFSHLLLADTFLHGRLTNPTHPFWPHFESMQIIQRPHYSSNYFPGHALILAAGLLVLHSAWAAILAECALFLIALFWALRGWMPTKWALFGILIAALRFAVGSYWVNAYHAGFLPALGGTLIAGAFARLYSGSFRGPRINQRKLSTLAVLILSAAFGLGVAILSATRPYEGLAFTAPFAAILLWQSRRSFVSLLSISIPAIVIAGVAVAGLGIYVKSVTGSPFVTAYQISQKTYGWPMGFPWVKPLPIVHQHLELQRYYEYETSEHEKVDGPLDFLEFLTFRIQEYWRFFVGPVLTIPLFMLGRVWKRRRILFVGFAGCALAVLMEGAASPHYISPATVMIIAILVECCRHLNASRIRILPLLPVAMAVVLVLRIGAQSVGLPYSQETNFQSWCCRVPGNLNKSRISRELDQLPGDHLVFVQTKDDTMNLFQWIYNLADLDHQRIVWARDLGTERNARLAQYFGTRSVWLVDPNVEPASYARYEPTKLKAAMPQSTWQSKTQPPVPAIP